jgi:hypothetical protein
MNLRTSLLAAALLLPLAACSRNDGQPSGVQSVLDGKVSQSIREAGDKARQKLSEGEISVSRSGQPKATISATGDLVIDGQTIAVDAAQRAQLLAYRQQLVQIASDGVDIGLKGAELGVGAAAEALRGVFNGQDEAQIKAQVEARAEGIKQAAHALCSRLPGLLTSQQALSSSVPAFAPYATMDQGDVDKCMSDGTVSLP